MAVALYVERDTLPRHLGHRLIQDKLDEMDVSLQGIELVGRISYLCTLRS